jgi:plastocyanin
MVTPACCGDIIKPCGIAHVRHGTVESKEKTSRLTATMLVNRQDRSHLMRTRTGFILAITLAALVALAACGGDDGDSNGESGDNGGSGSGVDMEMGEMYFDPESVSAEAGSSLEINLENAGTQLHDFTIDDLGGERVHVEVPSGEEDSVTLEIPEDAGEIEFYCSIPGHREAGMEGIITVE